MTMRKTKTMSAVAVLAAMLCMANLASASTSLWNGAGADNNWSTAGNWVSGFWQNGSSVPVGEDVEFDNSPSGLSVAQAPYSIGKLQLTATLPSSFTLSGSTLTVAGGIETQWGAHNPYTINNNVVLTGGTIAAHYNEGLNFGGNVSGSALTFTTPDLKAITITGGGSVGTLDGHSTVSVLSTNSVWHINDSGLDVGLKLDSNVAIDDTAALILLGGNGNDAGLLNLNFTAGLKETVASLTINGVLMPDGTYGGPRSGATNIDNIHFMGTGMLQVGAIPEPTAIGLMGIGALGLLFRRRHH